MTEVARENIFSKDVTVVNLPTSSVRQPTNHVHEICKSNEDDGEIVRWVICEALKSCRQWKGDSISTDFKLTGVYQHNSHFRREFLGLKACWGDLLVARSICVK